MMGFEFMGDTSLKTLAATTAALIALSCWTASAETSNERQACIGDAFRVCWSAIPNRNDVFLCLMENRPRLNPDCREVMNKYQRPHRRHRITRSAHSARAE